MPRRMPQLGSRFAREVDDALSIAQAGERIRYGSAPGSPGRTELTPYRLNAIYEMAYLRIFIAWEAFLEDSFLRYLCGYNTPHGRPHLIRGPFRNLGAGQIAWLGSERFVSWVAIDRVLRRCRRFVARGLHEQVLDSNRTRLECFAAIRHRIAHKSHYSVRQFDAATTQLAGRRYPGSSAGHFLRDWTPMLQPGQRWIQTMSTELKNLSTQIVP